MEWESRKRTAATEHLIYLKTETNTPHQIPYRQELSIRENKAEDVTNQLDKGVIEPAATEWDITVVFVPRSDGSRRFCVDYRLLKEESVADTYQIPLMDDCMDSFGDAVVFSTLDEGFG